MGFVQDTCKTREDMVFGYDWAGSTSADDRDKINTGGWGGNEVDWSSMESVRQSYWFKGYAESVKAEMKVLCQQQPRSRLRLLCISGGPISQLEAREIQASLVDQAQRDLATRGIELRVEVVEVPFDQFKELARQY